VKCILACDVFIYLVCRCTYEDPTFSLRNFLEKHISNGKYQNKNIFQKCSTFPMLPGDCGALCLWQFQWSLLQLV